MGVVILFLTLITKSQDPSGHVFRLGFGMHEGSTSTSSLGFRVYSLSAALNYWLREPTLTKACTITTSLTTIKSKCTCANFQREAVCGLVD